MTISVTIRDQTTAGKVLHEGFLKLLSAKLTVREIIRERILQEVEANNRRDAGQAFRGLVQPTQTETLLNKVRPRIDWRKQFDVACRAFEGNRFVVLVDDRQVESLDEEITVQAETTVSFLKLVPLVGG